MTAKELIETLELQPHPEGGFFKETYRCSARIGDTKQAAFPNGRSFSTAIYFLLRANEFSALHRIKSDEVWHFYAGNPITVHSISPEGIYHPIRLGNPSNKDCVFQAVVTAGTWFGASLDTSDENAFALVGCTVAPGFDFTDFEMPNRQQLAKLFPQHVDIIEKLTPSH